MLWLRMVYWSHWLSKYRMQLEPLSLTPISLFMEVNSNYLTCRINPQGRQGPVSVPAPKWIKRGYRLIISNMDTTRVLIRMKKMLYHWLQDRGRLSHDFQLRSPYKLRKYKLMLRVSKISLSPLQEEHKNHIISPYTLRPRRAKNRYMVLFLMYLRRTCKNQGHKSRPQAVRK